jgi:hypothetical protein
MLALVDGQNLGTGRHAMGFIPGSHKGQIDTLIPAVDGAPGRTRTDTPLGTAF